MVRCTAVSMIAFLSLHLELAIERFGHCVFRSEVDNYAIISTLVHSRVHVNTCRTKAESVFVTCDNRSFLQCSVRSTRCSLC